MIDTRNVEQKEVTIDQFENLVKDDDFAGKLHFLAVNNDATKLLVAKGKTDNDTIWQGYVQRGGYHVLIAAQSIGRNLMIRGEIGLRRLIESYDKDVRDRMQRIQAALAELKDWTGVLPVMHDKIGIWVGTTQQLELFSDGRYGTFETLELFDKNYALASKGNRLYIARVDKDGKITPATRWMKGHPFSDQIIFISHKEGKTVVLTLAGGYHQRVNLTAILAADSIEAPFVATTPVRSDGSLFVGRIVGQKTHVALIGHDVTGERQVRTFDTVTGDRKRLPAITQQPSA